MCRWRLAVAVTWITASLFLDGCASAYRADRSNDMKDILTFAVGLGLGAKARVGPLQLPLIVQSDYAGLRSGEFFASPMRDDFWTYVSEAGHVVDQPFPVYVRDYATLYSGYEIFDPQGLSEARHKRMCSQGMGVFATVDEDVRNYGFYTQIECTVGVIVSLRLGVNPGELIDALLGFVNVDLFRDDVNGEKRIWETN